MSTATTIIEALGGWENISNLEACITRIRLDAANTDLIDEAKLRAAGAFDVVIVGDAVQVVIGPVPRISSTHARQPVTLSVCAPFAAHVMPLE